MQEGVDGDLVADLHVRDVGADLVDASRELVAEREGQPRVAGEGMRGGLGASAVARVRRCRSRGA
jgi:hypothetical protein